MQYPGNELAGNSQGSSVDDDVMGAGPSGFHGSHKLCVKALIWLFLKHYSQAESATIEVHACADNLYL